MMRLRSLELSGFRGFGRGARIDLDADTVILVGANGSGKTSLFDALMWGLAGRVPRIDERGGSVVSEFAQSDEARVELELGLPDERFVRVTRSCTRDDNPRVQVEVDSHVTRGAEAQVALYRELWPDALSAPDGDVALLLALTRSVYLQQDLVREFVEADTGAERFEAVSELVGVGRIRELQVQLDKARRGWSAATNKLEAELEPRKRRLGALDEQLEHLSIATQAATVADDWREWWTQTNELLGEELRVPTPRASEAASLLDQRLKRLAAERRRHDRQLIEAQAALDEIFEEQEVSTDPAVGVEDLQRRLDLERARAREAELKLKTVSQREEELREIAIREKEQTAQLAALAELAMQHLDGPCPVCGQEHRRDETTHRLQALLDAAPARGTEALELPSLESLSKDARTRRELVTELEAEMDQRNAEAHARKLAADQRALRLKTLGITEASDAPSELKALITGLTQMTSRLVAHRESGERLALELAKSAEAARREELERQRERMAGPVGAALADIEERRATGALANEIFDALGGAVINLVDAQLEQISPLVERIYARIDPHPAFRRVALSSSFEHGRGRVNTTVRDTLAEVSVARPGTVLSSSQLNALAASIFLALNFGIAKPPLDAVLLDDPLQSLDDVNLLGLVDLLRRTSQRRQLLISTHDPRFARLLERKLRPTGKGRTVVLELSSWTREGPHLDQRDLTRDEPPLRLAA